MKPSDINTKLTAELLRSCLRYEMKSGKFFWLKANNQCKVDDEAGAPHNGYVRITIFGHRYFAHRLAWLYIIGEWPRKRIDHKNLCRNDNRWVNLRAATDGENRYNVKVHKNNLLGIKGIRFHECGKFTARIMKNQKNYYLGLFNTPEEAKVAYENAAKRLFGEFASQ